MQSLHRAGDVIGDRYRITEEIGSGGVATTYAAEDLHTGVRVAVKQLLLYPLAHVTLADAHAGKARDLLAKSGPSDEVERLLTLAEKASPWSAEAAFTRGLLHRAKGDSVRAKLAFERALKIDKDHTAAKDALAQAG